MFRLFNGTHPLLPSESLISSQSPNSSSTVTFVPSCITNKSVPLLSGELLPLITGVVIIALWLSYTRYLFLAENTNDPIVITNNETANQKPITLGRYFEE